MVNKNSASNMIDGIKVLSIFLWGLGAIFYAYEFALRTSMNAISQDMIHTLGFNASEISIIASIFYWFYVMAQIPAGILVDKYGPKRVLTITTMICAAGTIIFTSSNNIMFFCVGRALMGLGGGFAFVSTLKIASFWLPERIFPLFAGLTQFMGYLGAAFSGMPLVMLMKAYHWRSIFAVIAGVGALLFILSLVFSIGSTAKKAADEERSTFKETIINLLLISKNPQVLLNGLYCTFVMGATAVFADLWGIDYLHKVMNVSDSAAATACSIVFIGVACFSPFWGIIASILKSSKIPLVLSALLSVFTTVTLLYFNMPLWAVFAACFLFGGFQAVHVLNFTILRDVVDTKYLGSAIAFINMFTVAGGALFQPLAGIIIDTSHKLHDLPCTSGYNPVDFMIGLSVIPVVQVLAFIIAILLKEKKRSM